MKAPVQLAMPLDSPRVIEVAGDELLALAKRLRREERRIIALEAVGKAGWRAYTAPDRGTGNTIPRNQRPSVE